MTNVIKMQLKHSAQKQLLWLEYIGFSLAILICWATEIFDPPFSFHQVLIETIALAILGCFIIYWTRRLLVNLRYWEGVHAGMW